MLMQNFGVTNKEHYGMLWYFWSGQFHLGVKHFQRREAHYFEKNAQIVT